MWTIRSSRGVQVSATQQFFVMGGGLKHNVVANAANEHEEIFRDNTLPFECKLLAGIQAVIHVGGEVKQFRESVIAIDNPKHQQQDWFKSSGVPEDKILENLGDQIGHFGIHCPALEQVARKEITTKSGSIPKDRTRSQASVEFRKTQDFDSVFGLLSIDVGIQ